MMLQPNGEAVPLTYEEADNLYQHLSRQASRRRRPNRTLLLAATLVCVLAGAGFALTLHGGARQSKASGVTRTTDAQLTQVAGGVPGVTAVLGAPPADWDNAPANEQWIYINVTSDSAGSLAEIDAAYRAALVAGAYKELTPSKVGGYTYQYVFPDGSTAPGGGSLLAGLPSSQPTTDSEAQITQTIDNLAQAQGLSVTGISFLKPSNFAPDVTVQTSDPQKFFANPPTVDSIIGSVDSYEGFLLAIDGPGGQLVGESWFVPATGDSAAWRDPAYGSASITGQLHARTDSTG